MQVRGTESKKDLQWGVTQKRDTTYDILGGPGQ